MSHVFPAACFVVFTLAACRSNEVPTFREELAGTCWRLHSLAQQPLVAGVEVTLCFENETRIAGSGGCNRYFATARFEGDMITLEPIGATRMACEPSVMDQEQLYFTRLERSKRWVIDGDELLLFGEDPPALRFERLAKSR